MSLKVTFRTLFAIQCVLVGGLAILTAALFLNQQKLRHSQQVHHRSYLLADELRQSSDDLTRLARTYVATGNPESERQYWTVLGIRNGTRPRPADYNRIYWDLVRAAGQKPRPDAETISLHDLMMREGFTAAEFAKLATAQKCSDALVQTERIAMNAVKGQFDDGAGNFTVQRAPDRELAVRLMNDEAYHQNKAEIMRPIDDFFALFAERTAGDVARHERIALNLLAALGALIAVILGMFAFSFVRLQRQLTEQQQAQTELRLAADALHDSEAVFRVFMDNSPVIAWCKDEQGRQVFINQVGVARHPEQLTNWRGESDAELWPGAKSDRSRQDDLAMLASGKSTVEIREEPEASGASSFWHVIKFPFRNPSGTRFVGGIAMDITTRKQTEEALRESTKRLEDLTFILADWVWEMDEKGVYTFSSQQGFDYFGPHREDVIGKTPFHFMPPEEVPRVGAIFADIAARKAPIKDLENWNITKNGERICFLTNAVPLLDGAGNLKGYRGVGKNITARKQAEAALKLSDFSVQQASVPTFWIARDARIVRVNRAACALLGYSEAELLTMAITDLDPDFTPARWPAHWQELRERHQMCFETGQRHKSGRIIPVQVDLNWFEFDGREYNFAFIHDITERHASEKTSRLHGAALEAAANAIVITDRQGIIEWVNSAFCALSGWSFAEVVGKNPRDLVKSGQHNAAFYGQMWETLLAGKVWQGEIINRRKDGALRTENMTITPLRDAQGAITHFVAIKQDITDQKRMESHFMQAQRMEAIGALAGGVAHDLNNILTPILMVVGLVKDKLSDEGDRKLLAMAELCARRGAEIIKQLLTFSRGQQGERTVMQPRHLMTEMMAMMRETFPRDIDLQSQLAADLWPVIADQSQLHQVLMNLCVNARDAMPTGGQLTMGAVNATLVEGAARLPPQAKFGPYVVITVKDTGHGIPPEIKHRIFDPFFTTKPLGSGTGLGLSTLLGIVRSHDGFIEVDSVPSKGSTFSVYLPAVPDHVEAVAEVPVLPTAKRAVGQTILLVDDEPTARETMRVLLQRQHYPVLTAVNGQDAIVQYLTHRAKIDLVLTDLMMPVMGGIDLIRALRVINPSLKIIAMSGLIEMVEEQKLKVLGVPHLLVKPFDGATLLETVNRLLTGA